MHMAAVCVYGGVFIMNGGEIFGNTALGVDQGFGGGVLVEAGVFTMNGGEIFGNICSSKLDTGLLSASGGGVYVCGVGSFTMNHGKIYDNISSSYPEFPSINLPYIHKENIK